MTGQINIRVPAAAYAKRTRLQPARVPSGIRNLHRVQTKPAAGIRDCGAGDDSMFIRGRRISARIHNRGNRNTLPVQISSSAMSVIITGENYCVPRSTDAPPVGITAHCTCQHNPWAVVVVKGNWPLCSARAQHSMLGINAPQNLAWLTFGTCG